MFMRNNKAIMGLLKNVAERSKKEPSEQMC